MSNKQALPDSFHRSKLTSLTASTFLFAFSVLSSAAYEKAKILNIELSGLNRRFVVIMLAIAATISILSLIASYVNEGMEYQRGRLKREDFGTLLDSGQTALLSLPDAFRSMRQSLAEIAESKMFDEALEEKPYSIDNAALLSAIRMLWTESDANAVRGMLAAIPAKQGNHRARGPDFVGESAVTMLTDFILSKVRHFEDFDDYVRSDDLSRFVLTGFKIRQLEVRLIEINDRLASTSANFGVVSRDIRKLLLSARFARISVIVQITLLDFAVPALFYCVAMLHAIGYLQAQPWAPALPSLPIFQ